MMKQSKCQLAGVVMYIVLFSSTGHVFAEDGVKAQIPQVKNAFEIFAASDLDTLAPYAKMPDEKVTLPNVSNKSYPRVMRQFDGWLRRVLKSDCVPDAAFVEKHIRLVPAGNRDSKDDAAFLSYEIAGKTYMIVQTGGRSGRMWIFVHDPAQNEPRSASSAATRAKNAFGNYLCKKYQARIPVFSVKKANTLYIGEVDSSHTQKKKINYARWFIADSETCLGIQKYDFGYTLPARLPKLNEWFSWAKDP